jgi:DNA repair protein RadA/Sms
VNQLKYCCHELSEWAKLTGAGLVFVAHITKEGIIAGPKVIEHMVDTVLYFDQGGGDLRYLRSVKNRFGSVDEIGLFSMGEGGLKEVADPSAVFLVRRSGTLPPGVVVAPVYEGSRVLLVELQALVVPAKGGMSRVFADRLDVGRVSRIAAVLEKHAGIRFTDQDIYVCSPSRILTPFRQAL